MGMRQVCAWLTFKSNFIFAIRFLNCRSFEVFCVVPSVTELTGSYSYCRTLGQFPPAWFSANFLWERSPHDAVHSRFITWRQASEKWILRGRDNFPPIAVSSQGESRADPFTLQEFYFALTQLTRRTMSSALQSYVAPSGVFAFQYTFEAPLSTSTIVMSLGLRLLPILRADSLCKLGMLLAQPTENNEMMRHKLNNVFML